MISITSIASSSAGNCYLIDDGESPLLIECGVPIRRIKEALNFRLSSVHGCLLSHEHGDHAGAAKDILAAGIDVFTSRGTARELGIEGHHCFRPLIPKVVAKAGRWIVAPFGTIHDAAEPLGFFLAADHGHGERLAFLTDSAYSPVRFPGVNYLMVECNYSDDVLRKNVRKGVISEARRRRIMHSHFGLENVLEMLRANDLGRLREIHLIHLSDQNADAADIKRRVAGVAGVPVIVESQ